MQTYYKRTIIPISIVLSIIASFLVAFCLMATPSKATAREVQPLTGYQSVYASPSSVTINYNGISGDYYTSTTGTQYVTVNLPYGIATGTVSIQNPSNLVQATWTATSTSSIRVAITPLNVFVSNPKTSSYITVSGYYIYGSTTYPFSTTITINCIYTYATNASMNISPNQLTFNYTGTQSDYTWTSNPATVTVTGVGITNVTVDNKAGSPINAVKLSSPTQTKTDTWTFTVTPNILTSNSATIAVTGTVSNAWYYGNNYYPNRTITKDITVIFQKKDSDSSSNTNTTPTPTPSMTSFADVSSNAWYANDVKVAVEHGILKGWKNSHGQDIFGPMNSLTRAQAATILWRFAEPSAASVSGTVNNMTPWSDVSSGQYYTAAMNWAYQNNILTGYTATTVGPDDPINREQLCIILYKLATQKYGVSTTGNTAASYADATNKSSVADYAEQAVGWAYHNKIMTGVQPGNNLAADSITNRAEAAKMFVYTLGNLIGWDESGK